MVSPLHMLGAERVRRTCAMETPQIDARLKKPRREVRSLGARVPLPRMLCEALRAAFGSLGARVPLPRMLCEALGPAFGPERLSEHAGEVEMAMNCPSADRYLHGLRGVRGRKPP